MIYNTCIFVIGKDNFILDGVKALAEKFTHDNKNTTFTIKIISPIDLMLAESKEKKLAGKSIVIVTDEYEILFTSFLSMKNFIILPGNVKIPDLIAAISATLFAKPAPNLIDGVKRTPGGLKLRERQYCNLLYRGLSNEQISQFFQCSIKNVYYIKKRLMNKWNCKNSVHFYQCLHVFFCKELYIEIEHTEYE